MPLAIGATFAGYKIIRLLGSGGMGEVYLAEHPRLPRRDALKVLSADVSADPDYRARFNREADLASKLWHPNIVSVHDRGEEDGQLWISMDYIDGLDAGRLLASRYPVGMPVDQVTRIITAVGSALDYAHKQGLLHRDVKPANIMLTDIDGDEDEQRVLLADFGIARNVNDISGLTKTNMTVGTVAYCAPEQLLGEDSDGRADQYSLAATAYHLLSGSQLFPNSNPAVVISHHLNVTPPALADSRPELAALDPVLAVGLSKRPGDRFNRCSELARALVEQINTAHPTTQAALTKPASIQHTPSDRASAFTQQAFPPQSPVLASNDQDAASSGEPPRSRRGLKILVGVVGLIVIAVSATVAVIVGNNSSHRVDATSTSTSHTPSVNKLDVANQVSMKLTDAAGNRPESVTCPNDLPAKVGAQVNCEMKTKNQTYNVNVTVTSVNGSDVKFDMVETVDKDQVASVISGKLTQQVGRKPDSVTCPDNLKGTVGATLRCQLTDSGQKYGISVTVTSVDAGDVNFDFKVDDQAAAADYHSLLIKPSDIGGDLTAPQPPVLNPNGVEGVAQLFANPENSRRIGDTILIVDDPATAAAGLNNTKRNYAGKVSGTWQPVDVGANGAMLSGTSLPDKSQAITVVLFTEGKALVNLEFDSGPNDPIDADVATNIARKQAAAIKNGLPT